jgi:WD40 repeat protein
LQEILASSSWDKTVRLWDVFEGKGNVETLTHTHDVLTLAYHPDGKQLACSTLDGQIHLWNPIDAMLMGTIEGRRDIAGGRRMGDRRTAANTSSGKCFTCLSYSADGSFLIAGGSSKFICMYDVVDQVITLSLSLFALLFIYFLFWGFPFLTLFPLSLLLCSSFFMGLGFVELANIVAEFSCVNFSVIALLFLFRVLLLSS